MMRKQTDLRVRRTRALLRDALIDLIPEKGFDAVTVGDISKRAMVNRATFYRHYQDKYDLVASIFQDAVDSLISELGSPPDDFESFYRLIRDFCVAPANQVSPDLNLPLEALSKFFEHFARHVRLYRAMLGKRGNTWFTAQMVNYIADGFQKRVTRSRLASQVLQSQKEGDMPLDVATVCLASWLVSVLTWWLENGMAYSPQQIGIWSSLIICRGLHFAMGLNISVLNGSNDA